jgi:hypothetical protein
MCVRARTFATHALELDVPKMLKETLNKELLLFEMLKETLNKELLLFVI